MRINAVSALFFGIACIEEILLMGSGLPSAWLLQTHLPRFEFIINIALFCL